MTTPTATVLKEMAQITAITGKISSVQEKNLKMFPLVFFEGVKEVNIEYDLSPVVAEGTDLKWSGSFVSYRLTLDGYGQSNIEKRFSALEQSVHALFWDGIKVELFIDGNLAMKRKQI